LNSGTGPELALEIEFDQLWETSQEERKLVLGDYNDDDSPEPGEVGATSPGGRKRRRVWDLDETERREMRSERERCFHV
jgi:hypothetical protein